MTKKKLKLPASTMKKRVLIISDSPNHGFTSSIFTRYLATFLVKKGYKVAVFCPINFKDSSDPFTLVTPEPDYYRSHFSNKPMPSFGDQFGEKSIPRYIQSFSPDMVIFVGDNPILAKTIDYLEGDFVRIGIVKNINDNLLRNEAWHVFDINKFYGIDTKIFFKMPNDRVNIIRKEFTKVHNIGEDATIMLWLSNNVYWSSIPYILNQVDKIENWHPKLKLFMFAPIQGSYPSTIQMAMKTKHRLIWVPTHPSLKLSQGYINELFNIAHGVIIDDESVLRIEAAACQLPVIDLTRDRELIGLYTGSNLSFRNIGLLQQEDIYESSWEIPNIPVKAWDTTLGNLYESHIEELSSTIKPTLIGMKQDTHIDTIVEVKDPSYKIMLISTWKEKCGIAEYTSDLVNALKGKRNTGLYVCQERYNIGKIIDTVDRIKPNIIHFQHEFGIMLPPQLFSELVYQLRSQEHHPKIITTFHTDNEAARSLINILDYSLFQGADLDDKVKNAENIPHPIQIYEKLEKQQSKYKVIGTTGFIAPVKQLDRTMDVFLPHLKKHKDLVLYFVCSIHMAPILKEYSKQIIDKRDSEEGLAEVRDRIWFNHDFLSTEDLSREIQKFDLGFSWISINAKSNSGSASRIVGNHVPAVVAGTTHFSHLIREGLAEQGPPNFDDFVQTLVDTVYNDIKLESLREKLETNLGKVGFDVYSEKHLDLYEKLIEEDTK